jgi:hypothetical protein
MNSLVRPHTNSQKYDENPKIAARWYTFGAGVN